MKPHGSFTLSVKEQVIVIKAIGAWNYEAAVAFANDYKQLVSDLQQAPWGCLIDLTDWELFTPDASDYLDTINQWAEQHNQRFEAVVCGLAIQEALLEKNQSVFVNVKTRFCETLEEAYHWLESEGLLSNC